MIHKGCTLEKVRAVQEAREPRNVSELKSYLGLLTYYSRFLPNMATALNPLYNLLRKAVPWRWTARERHLKTLNSFLCRLKCWCILTQSSSWCWHVTHLRMVLGRYCHTACLMEQRSRSRLLLGRSQIPKGVIRKLRKKPLLLCLG